MKSLRLLIPALSAALVLAGFYACAQSNMLGGVVGSVPGGQYLQSGLKVGAAAAKAAEDFTPEQEYFIGRAVGAAVLERYKPLDNMVANDYLNLLGQTLALFSEMPQTYGGYHFLILDSDDINAFAAPGGLIFVTRGMIRCCPDENALAAVVAHEITHAAKKHALKAIKKSRITDAFTLLGSEAAKDVVGGSAGQLTSVFADSIGDITATMINTGYSRDFEREADRGAVAILTRAGYDPRGLIVMLQVMEKRLVPGGHDFAQTHPKPSDRINDLHNVIATFAAAEPEPAARQARFKNAVGAL
jgi:predicted Zn-dependent protease